MGVRTYMETYTWTGVERTHLMVSFYYGYLLSQIPSGYLAEQYGAKRLFALGVGVCGFLAFLMPLAARYGYTALLCTRLSMGICQGFSIPVLSTIFGRWIPPLERTQLLAFAAAGVPVGIALVFPISAGFAELYGWSSAFYFAGTVSLMFLMAWSVFVFDSPEEHPFITGMEKSYIISSIGAPAMGVKPSTVPWKSMATSGPFWALVLCSWCADWGSFMLINTIPLYLQGYFKLNLLTTADYMAIPYAVTSIIVASLSSVANYLISKEKCTRTVLRKISTAIGTFVPGILLIALSFQVCSFTTAITLFTLITGFSGFCNFGFRVNFNDISPSHAGLLWGIATTIGTISGAIVPWVTRAYIGHPGAQTQGNWQKVFLIGAAHYIAGGICYSLLGSGEQQVWDHKEKGFEARRTSPESLWEKLRKDGHWRFPMPKEKKSIPPWIPPSGEAELTTGTLERQEARRRSSIVPPM
ncbi:sialin-like isoform X2 [Paramacrobiotus metropolitanus]|uniref:sialin-like isoform X2 n=1 Tax=Paramacrobiotus metropolitanus TaxID=2943436 RepID=UPI002445AFD9|nr:sialin-like isoform X2 [Paramacrobiotus metropolitanus]